MTGSRPISRRAALNVTTGMVLALGGLVGVIPPAFSQQAPPQSDKSKQVVALVDKAAALIDSKGKAAFAEFRKSGSEWKNDDTYLFVTNLKGITLFHGALPEQEGTNSLGLKDANAKLFIVEMVNLVKSKRSGWVHYMFSKPGQSRPSDKWSYVKAVTVDGTPAFVGAGFYP